jgi:hypothetical protein
MPSPISPAIHPWIERLNLAFGTSKASSRSRRAPPYASPDCGLGAPRLRSVGDKEISATVELSVGGGLVPLQGKLAATMTHRFDKRALEALEPSLTAIGDARLIDRLAGNEELDVLVVRAVNAAATSASSDKGRLLGRVVKAAVLDDAKVDESALMLGVLEQIDASHIRCPRGCLQGRA